MADRRRAGLLVLLLVLVGAFGLVVAPFEIGAIRVAGVSVLWWYVGAVAPVVTVLVTALALGTGGDAPDGATGEPIEVKARPGGSNGAS